MNEKTTHMTHIWIEKVNELTSKVLMPLMAVTFILFNTVVNLWIDEKLETLQNVLAVAILMVVGCNLVLYPKKNFMPWMRENVVVMVYFIARGITLCQTGFEYSAIRTVFFEFFFLIGISKFVIRGNKQIYIKLFMWLEFSISFISLTCFFLAGKISHVALNFLTEYTYYARWKYALVFSNPNTAGIMAGFSVALSIALLNNKKYSKAIVIMFGLYNVIALMMFGCRSSEVGLIAVVISFAICKAFPKLNKRKLVSVVLILAVATLIPLYAVISHYIEKDIVLSDSFEEKINELSTGRYIIWKECVMTQKDDYLLGDGSLKLEQKEREDFAKGLNKDYYWRLVQASKLGPHNGYIAMISCSGWIGLILFITILLQRVKRAKYLDAGNWYLMLVFIFVINCFESLFILNRFFTCFYMLLFLETDMEDQTAIDRDGKENDISKEVL